MTKKHLLASLLSFIFVACGNNSNGHKEQDKQVQKIEKEAIMQTLEFYMEGSRRGDSKITAQAFAPEATLAGIYNGQFMVVPIQILYDMVDKGAKEASYTLTSCSIEQTVATVAIEAQFGSTKYTDMFTLVKDHSSWKIISKVYHRHE